MMELLSSQIKDGEKWKKMSKTYHQYYFPKEIKIVNDTLVLAICGKSATGKDSLANALSKEKSQYKIHKVVSDTSRPIRANEKSGRDYNFISEDEFIDKAVDGEYLEVTRFRGWYYGIPKNEIWQRDINIVVVDPQGLSNLMHYRKEMTIIPIYIEAATPLRLKRSVRREHKIRIEYLRRICADYLNFKGIFKTLKQYDDYICIDGHRSMKEKCQTIFNFLEKHIKCRAILNNQ